MLDESYLNKLNLHPVRDEHRPATNQQIAEFERRIQSNLPEEYKRFLKSFGMTQSKNHLVVTTSGHNEDTSSLEVFLGISPGDSYDLFDTWRSFQGRIAEGALPIATSPGGLFCICLSPLHFGEIWWWAANRGSQNPFDDMELIAASFVAFVNLLSLDYDDK